MENLAPVCVSIAASQQGDSLQGEWGLRQGQNGQPEEEQRAVIRGGAVEVDLVAAGAAVDEDPLAVAADRDGDGLHGGPALGLAVAWAIVIEVTAPEAVGAVVAVARPGGINRDVEAAMATAERVGTTWASALRSAGQGEPPGRRTGVGGRAWACRRALS